MTPDRKAKDGTAGRQTEPREAIDHNPIESLSAENRELVERVMTPTWARLLGTSRELDALLNAARQQGSAHPGVGAGVDGMGEAIDFLRTALDFAYQHGLHEPGYDPLAALSTLTVEEGDRVSQGSPSAHVASATETEAQHSAGRVKRTMTLTLTDAEMAALEELARKKDLEPPSIYRQALKAYQLLDAGHLIPNPADRALSPSPHVSASETATEGRGDLEEVPDVEAVLRHLRQFGPSITDTADRHHLGWAADHLANLISREKFWRWKAEGQSGWQPIETAPKDRAIIVFAPGEDPRWEGSLGDLVTLCKWHPDAGFCVCELREPTHWMAYEPALSTTPDVVVGEDDSAPGASQDAQTSLANAGSEPSAAGKG